MNKSGVTGTSGISSIDICLIVIFLFCGGVVVFVGILCCRRKRPAGKRRGLQLRRKRRKEKNVDENIPLKSSNNDQAIPSSAPPSRKHRKVSPSSSEEGDNSNGNSPKRNYSLLQCMKWFRKEKDVERGQDFAIIAPKKNTRESKKKEKAKVQKSVVKQHNMATGTPNSNDIEMKDISSNIESENKKKLMDTSSVDPNKSLTKQINTGEKAVKRSSFNNCYCEVDCKRCKPFKPPLEGSGVTSIGPSSINQVNDASEISLVQLPDFREDHFDNIANKTNNQINIVSIPDKSHPNTLKEDFVESDKAAPVDIPVNKKWTLQEKPVSSPAKGSPIVDQRLEAKLVGTDKGVFQTEQSKESIGNIVDLQEYAFHEWKGDTKKAETIRKGYNDVIEQLGFQKVRIIRGDNYCGIRATLFQALLQNIPILSQFKTAIEEIPYQLQSEGCSWINEWTFGQRIEVEKSKIYEKMCECLKDLDNLVKLTNKIMTKEGRESHLLSSLNFKQDYEIRVIEAVKLLMLATAVKLYNLQDSGQDIPIFAIIMFARDTSPTPCQLMNCHLNAVGNTGGLEQVEMHLLGYTLGTTIRVVRPSYFGQSDFIACFPDDMPSGTPSITLVAEDDRHYNVLM